MSKENYERSGWGRAGDGSPIRLGKPLRRVAKWIKKRTQKDDDVIYDGGTLPEVEITPEEEDDVIYDGGTLPEVEVEGEENPVKLTGTIKKIIKLIKSKGKPQL